MGSVQNAKGFSVENMGVGYWRGGETRRVKMK